MKLEKALTFKDVSLVPRYNEIDSRSDVNTGVEIKSWSFKHPMIVANMKTLVGEEMLKAIVLSQGMGFMHRFATFAEQLDVLQEVKDSVPEIDAYNYIGASVGIKNEDKLHVAKFYDAGIRLFCVDVAHADSKNCLDMVKWIKNIYDDVLLVAGNVSTGSGAGRLWKAGADVVKVGQGSGSICSTRLMAGAGVPQLHALSDIKSMQRNLSNEFRKPLYSISDGGCSIPGDVVKALCFADMVMAGNMFAGSVDTPGEIIVSNGVKEKSYNGSSTHGNKNIEGFLGAVEVKDPYLDIIEKIMQGLRSGCTYQGVGNLADLKEYPNFIEISASSVIESGAHNIKVV